MSIETQMRPSTLLTRDFLLKHYVQDGKTCKEIGEELGLSSQSIVHFYVKRYDLSKRKGPRGLQRVLTKKVLRRQYEILGKSVNQIRSQYGNPSITAVRGLIAKYGLKSPRRRWDSILTRETLHRHYVENLLPARKIKELYDVNSIVTVFRYISKYNLLPLRQAEIANKIAKHFTEKGLSYMRDRHGMTIRDIALKYDISERVVKKILNDNNMSLHTKTDITVARRRYIHSKLSLVGEISRSLWRRIKVGAKSRGLTFDRRLTRKIAWQMFLDQDRKCKLTGRHLTFRGVGGKPESKTTASFDRIDSSKGYCKSNCQWVHKDVNRLKMANQEDVFVRLCTEVADFARRS